MTAGAIRFQLFIEWPGEWDSGMQMLTALNNSYASNWVFLFHWTAGEIRFQSFIESTTIRSRSRFTLIESSPEVFVRGKASVELRFFFPTRLLLLEFNKGSRSRSGILILADSRWNQTCLIHWIDFNQANHSLIIESISIRSWMNVFRWRWTRLWIRNCSPPQRPSKRGRSFCLLARFFFLSFLWRKCGRNPIVRRPNKRKERAQRSAVAVQSKSLSVDA